MMTIGTRGSDLAMTQARHIAALLAGLGHLTRLEVIRTQGDRVQHLSLSKLEGKGFFTKELEDALISRHIDIAVHSLKDLPTQNPAGLAIGAIAGREDARDCLLIRRESHDLSAEHMPLKHGAKVGTSSLRRQAILRHYRPDLQQVDLRGNVPTRVQRLAEGRFDAIVLAQAGLVRLGLDLHEFATFVMPPDLFVPAPAQGALGVQVRADDAATLAAVRALHHGVAADCAQAERDVLAAVEGGCHAPLGAFAQATGLSGAAAWHMSVFWHAPKAPLPAMCFAVQAAEVTQLAKLAVQKIREGGR